MSMIDNPDLAKRLARAILSDVAMYNQDKVESGIKNDNIFDILKDDAFHKIVEQAFQLPVLLFLNNFKQYF